MKKFSNVTNQQGFTLIEVAVTMGIIIIGLLGLAAMQLQSQKAVQDSGNQALAIWVIDDLINRIRANEVGNYATGAIQCENPPNVPACASYNNGNAVISAEQCTEDQLADFDLYDVLCGMSGSATERTTSADALTAPILTVVNGGTSDSEHTITLSWISKSAIEGAADDSQFIISDDNFADNLNDSGELRSQYSVTFRP